jgi:hypothetical protein
MAGYIVLRQARLSPEHQPTGKTRHYSGAQELPIPAALQIVKYPDDPGYYLLYLGQDGGELTDTYHDTLERALSQAEWEFRLKPDEWEVQQRA